jgi:uncharacterized protein (TIGR00251 family)
MANHYLHIRNHPGGCTFEIRVIPRASQTKIVGVIEGALKVRIAAPPVEGAANDAVVAFFAKLFKTAKSNVSIVSGEHSKKKTVSIKGAKEEQVREAVLLQTSPRRGK